MGEKMNLKNKIEKQMVIGIPDSFRVVEKIRKEKKNLEGIERVIRKEPDRFHNTAHRIYIDKWNNWETSLWIGFKEGDDEIVVDSGVIQELAKEIESRLRLLKQRKIASAVQDHSMEQHSYRLI